MECSKRYDTEDVLGLGGGGSLTAVITTPLQAWTYLFMAMGSLTFFGRIGMAKVLLLPMKALSGILILLRNTVVNPAWTIVDITREIIMSDLMMLAVGLVRCR